MFGFNYPIYLCAVLLMMAGCSARKPDGLKADQYVIIAGDNAQSEHWAEYLYTHLSNRATDKSAVILQNGEAKKYDSSVIKIHFQVDVDLKNNYCIKRDISGLQISVHNDETALWIIYELIENIAETDMRFVATDLPLAVIDFKSQCGDFDFAYREPFFEPNLQPDYAPIAGNNNIETDWGIWGHNLGKIAAAENNEQFFASVNGKINKEQLDFSSSALYKYIENYISAHFGEGEKRSYRFMIAPNDNDLVCTCRKCTKAGNTKDNATPAVAAFVEKLAKRFPKHQFFLTAYRTTRQAPEEKLPENTGVFFSTIQLPKGIDLNKNQPQVKEFLSGLKAWKAKTPNIYLWDYAANFDDYITPLPVLYSLQKQLKFFKEQGIKGIFLNASGYDYSSFDDVKTYVAGALMKNTDANVDTLVRKFFTAKYPESDTLLTDYYLSLEKNFSEKKKRYNMYGSIREALDTYLDAERFVKFYNALEKKITQAKGEEKKKLKKLYTALSFTRLQIAYALGKNQYGYAEVDEDKMKVKPEVKDWLNVLEGFSAYKDMQSYKETGGGLSGYISDWRALIEKSPYENLLINVPLKLLSGPDEGFEKTTLLNDGTPGFSPDYHQGWYLCSTDNLAVSFPTERLEQAQKIKLHFLNDEAHGIFPPEKIELLQDGKLTQTIYSDQAESDGEITGYIINLSLSDTKEMEIKIYRKQAEKSVLACDEIQVLK